LVSIKRVDLLELSSEQIDEVLNCRQSAMLSFVDKAGYPRLLPCWFMWDGEAFCTTSDSEKFHVKCLRRDPRSAMCVEMTDGELPPQPGTSRRNWQVKGFGDMEILEDVDGAVGLAIRSRYLGPQPAEPVQPLPGGARLVLRLKPTRISAHGGGMVFGD